MASKTKKTAKQLYDEAGEAHEKVSAMTAAVGEALKTKARKLYDRAAIQAAKEALTEKIAGAAAEADAIAHIFATAANLGSDMRQRRVLEYVSTKLDLFVCSRLMENQFADLKTRLTEAEAELGMRRASAKEASSPWGQLFVGAPTTPPFSQPYHYVKNVF